MMASSDGATQKGKKKKSHRPKHEHDTANEAPQEDNKRKKLLDVTMEYLPETRDQIAPLVGYFPSGYDPASNVENDPKITVFRNKKRYNRVELVVRPSDESNVDFVGKSYTGEAAAMQICSYSIGILDKETRSLKIVPVATNKILRLEPRVKGKTYVDELIDESKDGSLAEVRKIDKIRELTSLYGSKKNKGMVKKFQALDEQRNNPDANEYLECQMKDVNVNQEAVENATNVIFNIPPHNSAATTPEKVYLLDKIIPKAEWNLLSGILEMVKSGKDLDSSSEFYQKNAYPSFVLNRLAMIRETKDENKKKELACILSYITHLINFMTVSSRRQKSSSFRHDSYDLCKIPQTILQKFKKLFLDPESQVLAGVKKDLLISYILVLTLFADDFKTKTSDIANDLKKPHSHLQLHYRQLGCKFSEGFAVLPVPLKIPIMRVRRRERRWNR